MCNPALILRIAGTFVVISALLAFLVHPGWLAFTAFVGFNMLQSSFTGFCPLERLLGRLHLFGCAPRRG